MIPGLYKKIKWLMIVRLIVTTIILVVGAFFLLVDKTPFYWLISLIYFATIIYAFFLRNGKRLKILAYSEIIVDVIVVTFIIHYSGGIESVLAILYMLSIISASIVISARAAIIVAGVSGALYGSLVGLEYVGIIPYVDVKFGSSYYSDMFYVLYLTYVRVTIFCLVGFLSGYLARRLTKVEKRMLEREKLLAMGEFAASIAHEIRNPLASLSGSIELLSERLGLDEPNRKLVELVVKESDRVSKIIEQFLEHSRSGPLKFERHNLNEILSEVLALARDSGRFSPDIKLLRENAEEPVIIQVDHQQIKQAFLNIIRNAIEAMPKGGELTVGVASSSDYAEVKIADTGVGIARDRMKKIFEPFQHSTKGSGTGTGLAIANCIIENHGGTINLKSKVGCGSTFTIRLPK